MSFVGNDGVFTVKNYENLVNLYNRRLKVKPQVGLSHLAGCPSCFSWAEARSRTIERYNTSLRYDTDGCCCVMQVGKTGVVYLEQSSSGTVWVLDTMEEVLDR